MKRKSVLVALLAGMFVMAVSASSVAGTTVSWTATVDSGGTIKAFTAQRVSKQEIWEAPTKAPSGGVKIWITDCGSYDHERGYAKIGQGGAAGMGWDTANICFRHKMARAVGADTNGILRGNGTTDIAGRVEY